MRAFVAILAVCVGFGAAAPSALADSPPEIDGMESVDDREVRAQLLGDVGVASLGGDLFLQLTVSASIAYDGWRFVPRLPLRFRMVDEPPPGLKAIRDQDWDTLSDFGRLLPHLSYGPDGELFHVRVGEMPNVTLGFGALIDRYNNTLDIDHYQTGVYASVNHELAGGQLFVDDAFDPNLAAMRVVLKPLSWVPLIPWPADKLQLGISVGADFRAPRGVAAGKVQPLVADQARRVEVTEAEALPLFAVDLSMPVDLFGDLRLTPYLEVASLDFATAGVHVGLGVAWRIDAMSHLRVRAEYRYHSAGHMPGYVSTFYDVERFSYAGQTKREHAAQWGEAGHGFDVEVELAMPPWLRLAIGVAHDTDSGTDVRVDLNAPNIGPVELRGSLVMLDIAGVADLDPTTLASEGLRRLMAVGQVRIRIFDWLHLRGAVKHQWRLTDLEVFPAPTAKLEGRYATGLDYEAGVQGQLNF